MFKHISIAYRQLFSKHSFGFVYVTSVLGVLGLSIGIASLIIISCLSDGFSNFVNSKLSSIDGHVRITSYYGDNMNFKEMQTINKPSDLERFLKEWILIIKKKDFLSLLEQLVG